MVDGLVRITILIRTFQADSSDGPPGAAGPSTTVYKKPKMVRSGLSDLELVRPQRVL